MLAPGAGRFVGPSGAVALLLGLLAAARVLPASPLVVGLFLAAVALAAFFAAFFRDPERVPAGGIVSAADGRVRAVEVDGDRLRISVFMNVTNVHVNRFPLDATVAEVSPGGAGHRPAYRPDADRNVRRSYRLETAVGEVEVVQITGILARRLIAFVRAGDARQKGQRLGMIVLGSRVDVVLPAARAEATVRVGEVVRAGTTPIARERP